MLRARTVKILLQQYRHSCDRSSSRMDFRFRWKSGRAADIVRRPDQTLSGHEWPRFAAMREPDLLYLIPARLYVLRGRNTALAGERSVLGSIGRQFVCGHRYRSGKPLSRPCHQCVISRLKYEEESMSEVDGATLIARSLKQQGIGHLFGVVGFPVTPIAAAAQKEGVAYIGMRNEQAASYAAQAYGYLTSRPGACIVVTGPGVVHGLAGLANAQQNCWPMILFGGASETYRGGMGAFQEERQVLIASPFCKFAHGIESVQRIPYYVEIATRNAIYGRPGATYLDVPDDIITGKCDVDK